MYKKDDGQITIAEFISPFGQLDKNNRWVRVADIIPWHKYEERYAEQFCKNNGNSAIPFRMAMGTLIIKQITGHSDDGVLLDITENPYLQYLIGLHEFTTAPPFSQSSISNFRKYIPAGMINEINDMIFMEKEIKNEASVLDNAGDDARSDDDNPSISGNSQPETAPEDPANKGALLLDATCAPAHIAYPTDVNLLNEAREKLEGMVDALHPRGWNWLKPRTYREKARRDYLRFIKQRKPSKKAVRKAIGQQLRYVKRDLNHVENMLQQFGDKKLNNRQKEWLLSIRDLYNQQQQMYDTRTHSVENRIVSISQPPVRPIVRGKTNAPVEFGAKVSVHMIEGYTFIDKIGWDAYNEESLLIPSIEQYRKRHGYYPEVVLVDKIYRNRTNRSFCKQHGIRISGPRLGRPQKETDKTVIRQERLDAAGRNAVEGKFGEGKTGYGLDRIMARLRDSAETVISMAFLCMNISRRLRAFLWRFLETFQNTFLGNIFLGNIFCLFSHLAVVG